MRIVFLADTDQPGQSGVADYALGLSASLRTFNVDSAVECLGPPNSSLRSSLVSRLNNLQPEWVSFQFVPYAFAHRGLVGRRSLPWQALRGRVGTHVMFHEIWIGGHQGASLRDQAIGALQRRGIKNVICQIRPDMVHCSNLLYSGMLRGAGIQNRILPLFGSIPICTGGPDPYEEVLSRIDSGSRRSGWIVVALFGSIHPSENLFPALRWLQDQSLRQGKQLFLVSLGHSPTAKSTFEVLAQRFPAAGKPTFFVKGPLDSADLSRWIHYADCGLATTPLNIIEKSSSAVAFAEHGVPVIVLDVGADVQGVELPRQDLDPAFWLFGDKCLYAFEGLPPRREHQPRLDRVTKQFMAELNM